ncbi:MAG: hypothetical protein ACXWP4_16475, partial [Polyangiales bacterium]
GGGVVGMSVTAFAALFRGDGPTMPTRLVAASLMGREALDRENVLPALLLGGLLTLVASAALGALFARIRRRELRTKLLAIEGVGFGLVMFAVVHLVLPLLDPTMAMLQPRIPLAIAYAIFGACLSLEAPLRVGSVRPDAVVRGSLA